MQAQIRSGAGADMADKSAFFHFAHAVAHASGRPISFVVALSVVVIWAVSGPVFGFSETWQLVINTGTTIVTFLMVFLVQATQNRDGEAIQAKLDELILTSTAENSLIEAEQLSEEELKHLRDIIRRHAARVEDELGERASKRGADSKPQNPDEGGKRRRRIPVRRSPPARKS
jgi:low affinity Fe/Cu permease